LLACTYFERFQFEDHHGIGLAVVAAKSDALWHHPSGGLAELHQVAAEQSGWLIVWRSGEAELQWGVERVGGRGHYELAHGQALRGCVDGLEAN
jgi:hypothetical protein